MKKKPAAKSKKKAGPVAEKGKKIAQKKLTKRAGGAVASNVEVEENQTDVKADRTEQRKGGGSDDVVRLWGDPAQPELRAIEPVHATVKANLNWLTKEAQKGDQVALRRLVDLAIHSANLVRALTTVAFDRIKQIALEETSWPVNITASPDFPEDLDILRERLNIGGNNPLGFNLQVRLDYKSTNGCREIVIYCLLVLQAAAAFERKKRDMINFVILTRKLAAELKQPDLPDEQRKATAINEHASRALANSLHREMHPLEKTVIGHVKTLRKLLDLKVAPKNGTAPLAKALEMSVDLPEPSPDSKKEWSVAVKALMMALTDDEPEKNAVLYEIGKYRADAYFKKERASWTDIQKAKENAEKTGRAAKTIAKNIQDGIFTQVGNKLGNLLKKPKA